VRDPEGMPIVVALIGLVLFLVAVGVYVFTVMAPP
jgi:hypothetical protein